MIMEVITDYGPDTPEETYIKEQLAELQESYRKAAEPLVQTLVRIRSYKTPRMFIAPSSTVTREELLFAAGRIG